MASARHGQHIPTLRKIVVIDATLLGHDPHSRPEVSEALRILHTLSVSCSFWDAII
jgi:hypothetical protein